MPDSRLSTPTTVTTPEGQPLYTETVMEEVDNRRQRAILIIILILAFIALLGLSFAVARLTRGTAAPSKVALPQDIEWVRSIYGWGPKVNQALTAPTDADIGPDGTIWTISGHDTIAGFNPDGTTKRVIQPKGVASLEGIAVDENGDLFVSDYGGQIIQFSPRGEVVDKWKVELPIELDVRDGKIAVASAAGVAVFTVENSKMLGKWGSRGQGNDQFDLPHGILLGQDGTVFVADTHNRRVRAFTPSGRLIWSTGIAPDRNKAKSGDFRSGKNVKGPFLLPSGITFNGKGQIVVIDPFRFKMTVLDSKNGQIVKLQGKNGKPGRSAVFGDFGQSDGLFAYPTGVSYDRTRDWFAVADTANNRVQILRIPGSGGIPGARLVGAFRLPMCVFCLPLILLLIALIISVMRRRKEKESEVPAEPGAGGIQPTPAPDGSAA